MTDIYREEILEHWQNPLNFGEMPDADLVIDQINPLCGDEVRFYFKFSKKHLRGEKSLHLGGGSVKIAGVSFVGNGCAISIASASILSEFIKGRPISFLAKLTGKDVLGLLGAPVAPARLKCVFLPLEAIKKLATSKN